MKHFFTTRVKVVLVIALILAVGLAITSGFLGKTPMDTLVQGVLAPLRSAASTLTAQAERYYNYMFRYEALEAENAALREKISQMEEDARLADSLAREIARLRQLLDLEPAKEGYDLVDAYIISWSTSDWSSTFTVNRGTNAGIQPGMCVITSNKEVVGLVVEAGPNYAIVKTVLDSTLEISAALASSGYSGMVQGGYAHGLEGLLRMDYLPTSAVLRNNDQVVTSGSTVYPRNLILGYVIDAGFDDSGIAKYAILKPAADIDSLEQVFILTDFTME